MKSATCPSAPPIRNRRVLHVDLAPFFVSVERAADPSLRGRPVVVGVGVVAAASAEAQARGVRSGQALVEARTLCPEAAVVAGDLERYARASDAVTDALLAHTRRVERPSADEAYADLTGAPRGAVAAAEAIKLDIQDRLGFDAALGLASTRLAARAASGWARPRGLLLVLPGYERSFLGGQPVALLDASPAQEDALVRAGLDTVGRLAEASAEAVAAAVGRPAAAALQLAARAEAEPPIEVAAAPVWVQEDVTVRGLHVDAASLAELVAGLARRASHRLRPFDLATGHLTVEVHRAGAGVRRDEPLAPAVADEDVLAGIARRVAEPLLQPATGVRVLQVRLSRLRRSDRAALFASA